MGYWYYACATQQPKQQVLEKAKGIFEEAAQGAASSTADIPSVTSEQRGGTTIVRMKPEMTVHEIDGWSILIFAQKFGLAEFSRKLSTLLPGPVYDFSESSIAGGIAFGLYEKGDAVDVLDFYDGSLFLTDSLLPEVVVSRLNKLHSSELLAERLAVLKEDTSLFLGGAPLELPPFDEEEEGEGDRDDDEAPSSRLNRWAYRMPFVYFSLIAPVHVFALVERALGAVEEEFFDVNDVGMKKVEEANDTYRKERPGNHWLVV